MYNTTYMISKYSHKELIWIDLEKSNNEELEHVFEEYTIPEYIKDMFKIESDDDKIYSDHNYIFAQLPLLSQNNTSGDKLIFIVHDDFIISTHSRPTNYLVEFFKEIELNIISNNKLIIDNNRLLFTYILKSLYTNSEKQLITFDSIAKNYQKSISKITKKLKLFKTLFFVLLSAIILILIYVFSNI